MVTNDLTQQHNLIDLAIELTDGSRPGPLLAIAIGNRAMNTEGNLPAAITALEAPVAPTPRERAALLWVELMWDGAGEIIPVDGRLGELSDIASAQPSKIIAFYLGAAESHVHIANGRFAEAVESVRAAQDAAEHVGARFYVHLSTVGLCAAAVAAQDIRQRDLDVLRQGLLEQRDAGQIMDQWLLLAGAALVFAQLGHDGAARENYAGVASSPWADGRVMSHIEAATPPEITEAIDREPVHPLADLVDRTLEILAELLDVGGF